jgi:hypothetical protein
MVLIVLGIGAGVLLVAALALFGLVAFACSRH